MKVITKEDMLPAFDRLRKGRIMVIGDLAIDEMVYGEAIRISREAPVLILKHKNTKVLLGTGANAAHNIAAYKPKKVSVLGVCGDDYYATKLIEAFQEVNIETTGIVKDPNRPTSCKTRISAASLQSVTQQIVRLDREDTSYISKEIESKIIDNMHKMAREHDAILLSDYGIGVITPEIINQAGLLAKEYNLIYVVDGQKQLNRFKGANIITPNQPEAEGTLGYRLTNMENVIKGGQDLLNMIDLDMLLMTRGSEGMVLFEKNKTITSIPAYNKTDVFDVTGAGDTVVGTLVLALAVGIDPKIAAILGNLAASIVVKTFGAAVTSVEEMKVTLEKLKMDYLAQYTTNN